MAKDTIVCIDLKSGKTLWKAEAPGEPKGRNCSSTPAVADGHVYGVGSTHLYCVDAETGKIKWSTAAKRKVRILSAHCRRSRRSALQDVTAYDAKTGKEKWSHPKARVTNASPVARQKNGKTYVISHTLSTLAAYDIQTGEEKWSIACRRHSTLAIQGDLLAVQCRSEKVGFIAVRLGDASAQMIWNHPMVGRRTQASPIIADGKVFLIENTKAICYEAETGKVLYEQMVKAGITSPAMADGKIYIITDRGNNLTMLRPGAKELDEIGKHRIKALSCPSPTIADGYVVVRQSDKLVAFDLTEAQSL